MADKNEFYSFAWGGYGLPPDLKVAVGDVTGNGRPNIVVLNRRGFLIVYEWRKSYYYPILTVNVGRKFDEIILADIDGCGVLEIVLGGGSSVIVYSYNNYRFKLLARENFKGRIFSMAAGDLDGDSVDEIAVSISGNNIQILEYTNRYLNVIATLQTVIPSLVGIGDVDGNGIAELVLLQLGSGIGSDEVIVYTLEDYGLKFLASSKIPVRASKFLKVLPVDNSGLDKIVVGTNNNRRLLVMEYIGDRIRRQWQSAGFYAKVVDVASGDWNGDGYLELFVAVGKYVYIYRWNGRTFVEIKKIDVNQEIDTIAAGDINFDGRDEIVVGTLRGNLVVARDTFKSKSQFLVSESVTLPKDYPDIIKVAEAKVTDICVKDKKVIYNKVIISGYFNVTALYVAEPDRSVRAVDFKVSFVHVVQIPGIVSGDIVLVDIEVEYIEPRFNPARPREIEVVIIARVIAYDITIGFNQTLQEVASEYGVDADELAEVNDLELNTLLSTGEKIKLPPK